MPENNNIIVASDFLRQYESKPTRKNYSSILKNYLTTFYPQLKQIKRRARATVNGSMNIYKLQWLIGITYYIIIHP